MKTATVALKALLQTRSFVYLDLYTFTLSDGTTVRLSGGDRIVRAALPGIPFSSGPNTWGLGCLISDEGVKATLGVEVNPVTIKLAADGNGNYKFNGKPLQQFIRARGLVGAKIRIERAFAPDWGAMSASGATGTINRFYGLYAGIDQMGMSEISISAVPMTYLLNQEMPVDLYQVNCANQLFDNKCGLAESSFRSSGAFIAGSTTTALKTGLSNPAGRYTLGKLRFTSGANSGLIRTVQKDDGAGTLTIIQPIASAPAVGDTYTVSYGCDLTWATCGSKFNNRLRFRGQTKIPPPESAV